jgi:hypothetical protein
MKPSVANKEIKVVYEDLRFLTDNWNESIDDVSIRVTSAILRKLLNECLLNKVANHFGIKIKLLVSSSEIDFLNNLALYKPIYLYVSGGAKLNAGTMSEILHHGAKMTPQQIQQDNKRREKFKDKETPIKLTEFLEKPCIIIEDKCISRYEYINYICNKWGGVHVDIKRQPDEKNFLLLDKIENRCKFLDKEILNFELLSIGQRLVAAEDVKMLIEKIKAHTEEI